MINRDSVTIVTSIPEFYATQDFYETTGLFINSIRRFDKDVRILVVVPPGYNTVGLDYDCEFVSRKLDDTELLMSNVLRLIPQIVDTKYTLYFTTENLVLQSIDYSKFMDDSFYVAMTDIEPDNTYFEFEKTLHKFYSGRDNTNEQMILEYMIFGRTQSSLWYEFNDLSITILEFVQTLRSNIERLYPPELYKYILPAADLVALNLLHQQGRYDFKDFPNAFMSMHPGLTEKYNPITDDSLFFQYSGLTHNNVDKFLDIPDQDTRRWLAKELIKVSPELAVRLAQ
jgi:hypothetical protein